MNKPLDFYITSLIFALNEEEEEKTPPERKITAEHVHAAIDSYEKGERLSGDPANKEVSGGRKGQTFSLKELHKIINTYHNTDIEIYGGSGMTDKMKAFRVKTGLDRQPSEKPQAYRYGLPDHPALRPNKHLENPMARIMHILHGHGVSDRAKADFPEMMAHVVGPLTGTDTSKTRKWEATGKRATYSNRPVAAFLHDILKDPKAPEEDKRKISKLLFRPKHIDVVNNPDDYDEFTYNRAFRNLVQQGAYRYLKFKNEVRVPKLNKEGKPELTTSGKPRFSWVPKERNVSLSTGTGKLSKEGSENSLEDKIAAPPTEEEKPEAEASTDHSNKIRALAVRNVLKGDPIKEQGDHSLTSHLRGISHRISQLTWQPGVKKDEEMTQAAKHLQTLLPDIHKDVLSHVSGLVEKHKEKIKAIPDEHRAVLHGLLNTLAGNAGHTFTPDFDLKKKDIPVSSGRKISSLVAASALRAKASFDAVNTKAEEKPVISTRSSETPVKAATVEKRAGLLYADTPIDPKRKKN